nr:hypothetical protein [Tanacetum cinerariifolium]
MLGAARVQIPENNLDNLHSSREEDGTSETMDHHDLYGFVLLADADLITGTLVLDFLAGFESLPPMLNKDNYVPWSSRLLRYAKSRPNGKLIHNSILNAGFESLPPMLNKDNYVPWSSRLLRFAKSRPNGKLIHNSILNGPYVRKMIPEPGDANCEITVTKTFHLQTDDELSDKELKQIEADDQAIQTILLGLPEDIYAAVDSCETAHEIWLRTKDLHTADYTQLYDFLKYNQKEVDELKDEQIAKTQDPLALMANSNNPYVFPAPHQDQSSFNQNYLQQPMPNPEYITDPTTAMNMALALMAKAFKLNYSTPTNNNQRISSNPMS